jgi:hypothetical protein
MTTLAGICRFTEANDRARVFALCDLDDRALLVPISASGEQSVRGIKCTRESHLLELRMSYLPAALTRIFVGISVPTRHRLGEADFVLRLSFDSNGHTDIALPRALGADNRYAILALLLHKGAVWDGRRLREPEVYADRPSLAAAHPVPTWWSNRA